MDKRGRIAFIMVTALFLCAALPTGYGVCEDLEVKIITSENESESTATKVNNQVCPVSEDDIIRDEAIMAEYDGKIYFFCCEACVKHFKKYPAKFVGLTNNR